MDVIRKTYNTHNGKPCCLNIHPQPHASNFQFHSTLCRTYDPIGEPSNEPTNGRTKRNKKKSNGEPDGRHPDQFNQTEIYLMEIVIINAKRCFWWHFCEHPPPLFSVTYLPTRTDACVVGMARHTRDGAPAPGPFQMSSPIAPKQTTTIIIHTIC